MYINLVVEAGLRAAILVFFPVFLGGCLSAPGPTLVVTDYVQSRDMSVPNMGALVKAANTGDIVAQEQLGSLYYRGLGVRKSHKNAKYWWERAANSGYSVAQYNLGMLYFHGVGVKTDFIEGCKWLGLAASQGNYEAAEAYSAHCD